MNAGSRADIPLDPIKVRLSAGAHPHHAVMYGRPPLGKEFLAAVAFGLERSCIRPVVRGRLTASPDGFRGSALQALRRAVEAR
jgi:hypothetical protein